MEKALFLLPLKSRSEIRNAIEAAIPFGGVVWQADSSTRVVRQIVQISLDIKSERVIFKTNGLNQLDPDKPLYVKLCYRNIIFCLDPAQFMMVSEKICISYPEEARAIPKRDTDRYVMPIDMGVSLSLKKLGKTYHELVFDLEVRVVDVSKQGFGILISGANKDYFRSFDRCCVKAIDQKPLDLQLFGKVCYLAPNSYYLKRGDVRVGLSLNDAIEEETFERLKKLSKQVLSA